MAEGTCTVDDCDGAKHGKLYCIRHYRRWKKYGDPLGGGPDKGAAQEFFLANLMTVTGECKVWPYSTVGGYGRVTIGGRKYLVHRVACEAWNGLPPPGRWDAAHGACHNRACFNGAHLTWKTRQDNCMDRDRDGTGTKGEANKRARLTEVDVMVIRTLRRRGETLRAIADAYSVAPTTISEITNGRNWTHVQ